VKNPISFSSFPPSSLQPSLLFSTVNREIPNVSKSLRSEFARGDGRTKRKEDERRKNIQPSETLFVVNFHEETTKREDLQMLFEPFGQLVRIDMKRNYAFVQYTTIDEAKKAKEATNGGKLDSSVITVEYVARRMGEGGRDGDRRRRDGRRGGGDRYGGGGDRGRRGGGYGGYGGYDRYDDRRGGGGGYDRYDDRRGGRDRYDDRRRDYDDRDRNRRDRSRSRSPGGYRRGRSRSRSRSPPRHRHRSLSPSPGGGRREERYDDRRGSRDDRGYSDRGSDRGYDRRGYD